MYEIKKRNRFMGSAIIALAAMMLSFLAAAAEVNGQDPPEPRIHGPRAVGTTPGRPFLFLVPATGDGPLEYMAAGLPEGLTIDKSSGIISGSVQEDGVFVSRVTVVGDKGEYSRNLVIVAGKGKLAQTPPMGWNSWNVWGLSVSDDKVRAAADAMVSSGLAAKGYSYINIDDGWENGRAENGEILTNDKFPDMNSLSDYVHGKGLKLGIYSSPGPKTCGQYEGSYGHERQDAETYAAWGIDYLKYDLCSYGPMKMTVLKKQYVKPYREMGEILASLDRDIVYSICEYGLKDVETWGEEVGGNLWRTTGDIRDTWGSMSKIGFGQNGLEPYAGPGHWNDPDMLVVGKVGWGPNVKETRLTPDEQVTHITLWSMLASPLLIGCDMADMDKFTLDVLTNHDVIEVNQDPLGKQGSRVAKSGETEVWSRPLWDGTRAVALFNRSDKEARVKVEFSDVGLSGPQPARDLWLQQDLGEFDGAFETEVSPRGAVLVKLGAPAKDDYDPLN